MRYTDQYTNGTRVQNIIWNLWKNPILNEHPVYAWGAMLQVWGWGEVRLWGGFVMKERWEVRYYVIEMLLHLQKNTCRFEPCYMRDDNLSIDIVDDIYSQKLKLKVFKLTFECSFFSLFFLLHNLCLEKNNNVPRWQFFHLFVSNYFCLEAMAWKWN